MLQIIFTSEYREKNKILFKNISLILISKYTLERRKAQEKHTAKVLKKHYVGGIINFIRVLHLFLVFYMKR